MDSDLNKKNKIIIDVCEKCGAENSIRYDKRSIDIDDKQRTSKDLTFDFCEECGDVTHVDIS